MDRLNSENKSKYAQRTADAGGGFFGFIKAHKVTDAIVLSGLALGIAVPSVVVPVNAQTMSTNNGNQGNDSNNNGTTTPGNPTNPDTELKVPNVDDLNTKLAGESGSVIKEAFGDNEAGKVVGEIVSVEYIKYDKADKDGNTGMLTVRASATQTIGEDTKNIISSISMETKTNDLINEFILNCNDYEAVDIVKFADMLNDNNKDVLDLVYSFNSVAFVGKDNKELVKGVEQIKGDELYVAIGESKDIGGGFYQYSGTKVLIAGEDNGVKTFGETEIAKFSSNKSAEDGTVKFISINFGKSAEIIDEMGM